MLVVISATPPISLKIAYVKSLFHKLLPSARSKPTIVALVRMVLLSSVKSSIGAEPRALVNGLLVVPEARKPLTPPGAPLSQITAELAMFAIVSRKEKRVIFCNFIMF
jgi:hypothetical protein